MRNLNIRRGSVVMMAHRNLALVLLSVLATACADRTMSKLAPTVSVTQSKLVPLHTDFDILFVIDNSASTSDKQQVFAANFDKLVAALDAFPTGRPDLHIAVVDSTVDIHAQGWSNGRAGCPSPDPWDDGLFQTTPRIAGCTPPSGPFITDVAAPGGGRTTNYTGTLEDTLACIGEIGSTGCGFEAPLEAMKRALDGTHMENANFLRDGAFLAVIVLTDEDDASVRDPAVFGLATSIDDFIVQPLYAYQCDQPISPTMPGQYTGCHPRTDSAPDNYLYPPDHYVEFLSSVKDPRQTVVAAIAGPPPYGFTTDDSPPQVATLNPNVIATGPLTLNGNVQPLALLPSCQATINGSFEIGRPALRLASFVRSYSSFGRFYDVCQADFSPALSDIGKTLFRATSPCLPGAIDPADTDAHNPGFQPQCTVHDVQHQGAANQTETQIPPCHMDDPTHPTAGQALCWWTAQNPTVCTAPDTGWDLQIVRAAPPPDGTIVEVECVVDPT